MPHCQIQTSPCFIQETEGVLCLTEDTEANLERSTSFRDSFFHSYGKHYYFKPSTETRAVITSQGGVEIPLEGVMIFPTEHREFCYWQCRLTPWRAAFPLLYSWGYICFQLLFCSSLCHNAECKLVLTNTTWEANQAKRIKYNTIKPTVQIYIL